MAAVQTVPQHLQRCNFAPISPRHGVVILFVYGMSICVDRGHLTIEDGIGQQRRYARFPRVGHGLKRLVAIGSDGIVSLAALRWLADQKAAFVMLERDGRVLATTGPIAPSDARLRRAQSLAHKSGIALSIAKELIHQKLVAQEQVLTKYFPHITAGDAFLHAHNQLAKSKSSDEIRLWESQAAKVYWGAWRDLSVTFPKIDSGRVPEHWKLFGSRISAITSSPRLAVNPINSMLNFLYSVLESESRLALAALGLDPGIGVLHNDSRTRDSLACDLMEPIRPKVDAYLLDWLQRSPVKREWFCEQPDGNCRLMSSLAIQLSETSDIWAKFLAPFAEGIAKSFWSEAATESRKVQLATRLTQNRKREAKGVLVAKSAPLAIRRSKLCQVCGTQVRSNNKYCQTCAPSVSSEILLKAAKLGRVAAQSPEAQALRSEAQRRQMAGRIAWNPKQKPDWLDGKMYKTQIQPKLGNFPVRTLARMLTVSNPYATSIRSGKRVPHPRHWMGLANLVGCSHQS